MNNMPFQVFEHMGHKLIRLPKDSSEVQNEACMRCVRHVFGGAFKCMELPNCADAYFKLVDSLTPEENAMMVANKLEGRI